LIYLINDRSIMQTSGIKEAAKRLVEQLPDNSTWEDLMHEIYVRQAIEKGLTDSEAGRTTSVEKVREQFGLEK
jgi:hypothetical protein